MNYSDMHLALITHFLLWIFVITYLYCFFFKFVIDPFALEIPTLIINILSFGVGVGVWLKEFLHTIITSFKLATARQDDELMCPEISCG